MVVRVGGGKANTRAVFVQGTGLSSLARTYTYKHTLSKNRGLLWTPSPVRSTHYSHTLYHIFASLSPSFSYLYLSLSITNDCLCLFFLPSVTFLQLFTNCYSCFTSVSDVIRTSQLYFTCVLSLSVSHLLPVLPC